MYQFERDNKMFWFTSEKQAIEWSSTYLLDKDYQFTKPTFNGVGWIVRLVNVNS